MQKNRKNRIRIVRSGNSRRHPEFCFRGAKDTFPNIGGANYEFTVMKSQILQVLKHHSPPCCDATAFTYWLMRKIQLDEKLFFCKRRILFLSY